MDDAKKNGITVVARQLTYALRSKQNGVETQKKLLDNVEFCARPGQMIAIMGPSGAGKTMLLNALAGRLRPRRRDRTSYTGHVYYNGKAADFTSLRSLSCYVTQEDVLFEHLTVRETLQFSARLRLPELSEAQLSTKVADVIETFGLEKCQNVIVGGIKKKGISGGQKKRLSIASEMLSNPSLVFLDEPTSGLDSSLAYDVLEVMIKLAREKKTVICTIHQPRSQLFQLFDQLVLLCGGKIVYHGPAAGAQEYFASIGHPCPWQFNPADFFLDLMSGASTADDKFIREECVRRSEEAQMIKAPVYPSVYYQYSDDPGPRGQAARVPNPTDVISRSPEYPYPLELGTPENATPREAGQRGLPSSSSGIAEGVVGGETRTTGHRDTEPKHDSVLVNPQSSNSSVILGRVFISQREIDALPDLFKRSPLGRALEEAVEEEGERKLSALSLFAVSPMEEMGQLAEGADKRERLAYSAGQLWGRCCAPRKRMCSYGKYDPTRATLREVRRDVKIYAVKFWALVRRAVLNNLRNPFVSVAQLTVHIGFGLMLGVIFFNVSRGSSDRADTEVAIRTIMGYIYCVASQFAFANMDTLVAFPKERVMFNRESAVGMYPPSSYFLAKTFADFPFQHTAPLLFSIIAYFMAGLAPTFEQFMTYCVMGFVCVFASASYFVAIGSATVAFEIANLAAPFGGTLFLLLTGFFVEDSRIPSWISWLKYVNYLRFSFFGFLQNEFRGAERMGTGNGFISNAEALEKIAGIPSRVGMWGNTAISFAIGCGFRLMAFIFLKFLHRAHGVFT